ncbi:hypothetical protein C6568_03795 [Melaminivora suipulveris]|uniref:Uncharacterized protein n=1 Tax=Melaminivora suipulveris TaxID=2109913 RepID=A0A2R3Q9M8_9BURK|nr:hypothetical protein [Melaminivora suipulveris]AVO48480.1 hypothetical protein C6568_03795 [Melaminivora suipulveris]
MKNEILSLGGADAIGVTGNTACELLDVILHPGMRLELVGANFTVQATLPPAIGALLVSRLGYELASHIWDEAAGK